MNDILKAREFAQMHKDDIIKDIKALVDIPSVEGEPCQGAPAGKEVRRALDKALEIASRFGLETQDNDGYMGVAQLKGKTDKQIATIAHIDVVPKGNGWTNDAFDMQIKDGYLIGRGVIDDKGPAILTLYMAKYFKDKGELLPYDLRILLGTSEETGMSDVDYYLKHNKQPDFCLTPDSEFPVCFGEKGIYSGDFISEKIENGNIVNFSAGVASNVVPDRAFVVIKADANKLPNADNIKITVENGNARLEAFGKGGHAAMPEDTLNAIGILVNYMLDNNLITADEQKFLMLLKLLFEANYGKALGIAKDDGMFTALTCIGGLISFNNGVFTQNINVRYPSNTTGDEITEILQNKAAEFNARFVNAGNTKPMLIKPDSEVIKILTNTYNECTNQNKKPYTMGGGTYARHFNNAVAFGIEEPDLAVPDFVGTMHGANEGVSIDLLLKGLECYIVAIERLMKLKF